MGYRSDVSVAFYSRDIEHLPLASLKFWFDETYPKKEAVGEWGAEVEVGGDYILVTYSSVKWYPSYSHVDAVRSAIDKFEEAFDADEVEGLGAVELVEVGEEMEDIKARRSNYCDYRLGVNREIVFY
jgi:hypothetical protein